MYRKTAPALHLKLYIYGYLNRNSIEPAARARVPAQSRGDVAAGRTCSRPQDDCRFPQGQWRSDQEGMCSVRRALPPGGPTGGKGFVPVGQQSGVLVAFAAEPGKTASDIGQGSGPYTAALATELLKPGQSDLIMFHRVRVAVIDKTKGDQVPWTEAWRSSKRGPLSRARRVPAHIAGRPRTGIQRRERVLFGGEAKSIISQSQAVSPPALASDKPARKNEAPTVSGMLRCAS